MDAEGPVILDQLAGEGLGGIDAGLEAAAETGVERLDPDDGAAFSGAVHLCPRDPHAAVWNGCQSSPSLRQPTTSPDLMRLMS